MSNQHVTQEVVRLKKLPIENITYGEEHVAFTCSGNTQFVVLPQDIAARVRSCGQRGQQHVQTSVDDFTAFVRPKTVAALTTWADSLNEEKARALATLGAE